MPLDTNGLPRSAATANDRWHPKGL